MNIGISGTQMRAISLMAIWSASVACLSIISTQSSLGQLQQSDNTAISNSSQTVNLQNITSQQQPRSINDTVFSTYISPELGIQIDHPTDWSPLTREYADDVLVLEFNASRSEMMQLLPPTVRISSAPQPDISNLDQLTNSLLAIASDYPRFSLKENSTQSLGNLTAQKVLYTYGTADPSQQFTLQAMDIWTLKDGKRYVISYIAPMSEFSMNLPVVEHMIRTLTFE
jgi:PsbP-like protein